MKKQLLKGLLLLLWFLVFTLMGCKEEQPHTYSRDLFAMDTYITCKIVAQDEELARAGLDEVDNAFLGIDLLTNRFDEKSEVYAVNKNAGIAPVEVSEDLLAIMETALLWSDKTGGDFNILIGSVMDLWGFGSDNPRVPAGEDLAEALSTMDYHKNTSLHRSALPFPRFP